MSAGFISGKEKELAILSAAGTAGKSNRNRMGFPLSQAVAPQAATLGFRLPARPALEKLEGTRTGLGLRLWAQNQVLVSFRKTAQA
jgi:hypothetical protein